jgi:hypothetical protein
LRYRITALKLYLNRLGINCKFNQHYRSKKTAHRWSTAYQIAIGNITLEDLRRLKNGKDQDGNIWYKKEWDLGEPYSECAKISTDILDNAIKVGPPRMVYAEEGYESDDPRRYPNVKSIPVSKHVYGKAIDFEIDWNQFGGAWSSNAAQIISQFGLIRPVKKEDWHFELDINRKAQFAFNLKSKNKKD